MRTDRIARSSRTTGQGARHVGASLAPGAGKSLAAVASCASSLQAALRSDDAVGAGMLPQLRGCHCSRSRGDWGRYEPRCRRCGLGVTKREMTQYAISGSEACCWGKEVGLSLTGAGDAYATVLLGTAADGCFLEERVLRQTYISWPCGHRLSGDEAGLDARRCEQGR